MSPTETESSFTRYTSTRPLAVCDTACWPRL